MALYLAYSRSSAPSRVQNSVTLGRAALYAARSSGVSATAFRWLTAPQARPRRSVATSNTLASRFQLAGKSGAVTVSRAASAVASRASTAGST